MKTRWLTALVVAGFVGVGVQPGRADGPCADVPSHSALTTALTTARAAANGGFNLDMWATVVNRDGVVCAVAFTGGRPRRSVAGQPRDLRAEGEHGECVQPAGAGAVDGEPVHRGAAGRQPVRVAGE